MTTAAGERHNDAVEPFKNVFHPQAIRLTAELLGKQDSSFDRKAFVRMAENNLEALELKQRSEQIYHALCRHLPADFECAAEIIRAALHPSCDGSAGGVGVSEEGIRGWMIMPLAEYAGRAGAVDVSTALGLLRELTMRFTSEFGIRHLWLSHPQQVMTTVSSWVHDENEHVRRLVSEGSRPRLPWGRQLPDFIAHPQATWHLLEGLRDDPSPYVRKSVANHLNDNARDHPQLVLDLARQWHRGAPLERQRLLRHALRNLLKQGHPQALALYQLDSPQLCAVDLNVLTPEVKMGGELAFDFRMQSAAAVEQKLRLDLVLHYQKAKGTLAPKVYRWKDLTLAEGEVHEARRRHSFRPITTRVYHPGRHSLEIKANGQVIAAADFQLLP